MNIWGLYGLVVLIAMMVIIVSFAIIQKIFDERRKDSKQSMDMIKGCLTSVSDAIEKVVDLTKKDVKKTQKKEEAKMKMDVDLSGFDDWDNDLM